MNAYLWWKGGYDLCYCRGTLVVGQEYVVDHPRVFCLQTCEVLLQQFYVYHLFVVYLNINIIMGSNTSKIKDILFVTGADLDPPELHAQR